VVTRRECRVSGVGFVAPGPRWDWQMGLASAVRGVGKVSGWRVLSLPSGGVSGGWLGARVGRGEGSGVERAGLGGEGVVWGDGNWGGCLSSLGSVFVLAC